VPERERFWQVPFVKMIGSPPHLVIQAALCQKFGRDGGKLSVGFVGCTKITQNFSNACQKRDEHAH
jgi:hypothetical protein